MKKVILRPHAICVALLAGISMVSCVDDDYDLSKDIDLTVTVGGNLTLPPSNTEPYSIAQILDLDPQNSSIKPEGEKYGLAKGDYVLVQEGSASNSSFRIGEVSISDISSTPNELNLPFVGTGTAVDIKVPVSDFSNTIDLEDNNVNRQLVSLKEAVVEMTLALNLEFKPQANFNGSIAIDEGFTISLPAGWYLKESSNGGYTTVVNNNTLRFVKSRSIPANTTVRIEANIEKINFDEAGGGQGLVALGHFKFNGAIVSNGNISVNTGSLQAGVQTGVKLSIAPSIASATLVSFTGRINPDINVASTSFEITGVPDFLKEPGNNLDMSDPRINLSVSNTSPLDVNINGLLRAFDGNGNVVDVWVGDEHDTDQKILVKGNATTLICISRTGTAGAAGAINVAVPNLSNLIKTIPERIEMTSITAKVPQDKDYTLLLKPEYYVNLDYNAVIPLAFGSDLKLTYTTSDDGWEEELDKYNFREVVASIKVENTAPLDMKPRIFALDAAGNEINDVEVTVKGSVAGGTLASPSESELEVTIKSNASNIGRLGGVRFEFDAYSSPGLVGLPLNVNQALRFVDVRLQLRGGVDIDLN